MTSSWKYPLDSIYMCFLPKTISFLVLERKVALSQRHVCLSATSVNAGLTRAFDNILSDYCPQMLNLKYNLGCS